MKKIILPLLVAVLMLFLSGCSSKNEGDASSNKPSNDSANVEETESKEEIPELTMSWGNELHTGVMNVVLKKPEVFKEKGVYLNPLSSDKFELIENDKKIKSIYVSITLLFFKNPDHRDL